jgi:hypothetical protein
MGESRGVFRVLAGKPKGNRSFGRPRRGWENNIKIDLQEVGKKGEVCVDLTHDRDRWRALVNAAMNLEAPQNAGQFLD